MYKKGALKMAGFLAKLFKTNRKEFEEHLKNYLMDEDLSPDEIESLNEIARENDLSGKDLEEIYRKSYAELFDRITGLNAFDEKIYKKLSSLQNILELDDAAVSSAVKGQAEKLFLNLLRQVTESLKGLRAPIEPDVTFPDSESYADRCEMYLNYCADKLDIDLEGLAKKNLKDFRDYTYAKVYYDLSNGKLPLMDNPGILLQNGEVCHWYETSNLIEERTVSERVGGYSGVSVHVAKGVTLHTGGSRGHTIKHTEKTATDTGMLVITNKRVIFNGEKKTISIPYSKVVDIIKYSDAVTISRTGKSKFEAFSVGDPELVERLIMTAINK